MFRTTDRWSPLVMRLALAAVVFPHGARKVFGWFGGPGLEAWQDLFAGYAPDAPAWAANFVAFGELLGAVALALGCLTRVAGFGVGVILGGALWAHRQQFFANWEVGSEPGLGNFLGIEYHILGLGLALALTLKGAGTLSLDHRIASRSRA